MKKRELISVIIPFYNGNKYLDRLLSSIFQVENKVVNKSNSCFEILIINDSPNVKVIIPKKFLDKNNIKIINNSSNLGIHRTKINGYNHALGKYLIFLDQDDEMVVDGFKRQVELINDNDVVVGNSYYQKKQKNNLVFKNLKVMKRCVTRYRTINVRNFVPSLGCCIFKKSVIPDYWLKNPMFTNGCDDYYLLLILLTSGVKFAYNEKVVYCHNEGNNLSNNSSLMHDSALEMLKLLEHYENISKKEIKNLKCSIEFQYYKNKNFIKYALKYKKTFFKSGINKIAVMVISKCNLQKNKNGV